jgi:hypothetical protein
MPALRRHLFRICGFAIAAAMSLGGSGILTVAAAQESAEQTADEDEVIEEIVVIAGKRSGDPIDLDALHEEMMRDRLMTDIKRLEILEEQNEWRSPPRTYSEKESRIGWGYKPEDDVRMGRESDLSGDTFITTKPASLFRYEF